MALLDNKAGSLQFLFIFRDIPDEACRRDTLHLESEIV